MAAAVELASWYESVRGWHATHQWAAFLPIPAAVVGLACILWVARSRTAPSRFRCNTRPGAAAYQCEPDDRPCRGEPPDPQCSRNSAAASGIDDACSSPNIQLPIPRLQYQSGRLAGRLGVAGDLGSDDLGDVLSAGRQDCVLFPDGDTDLAGDSVGLQVGSTVVAPIVINSPGESGDGDDEAGSCLTFQNVGVCRQEACPGTALPIRRNHVPSMAGFRTREGLFAGLWQRRSVPLGEHAGQRRGRRAGDDRGAARVDFRVRAGRSAPGRTAGSAVRRS